jgi:RNA polymerase sigma factor (TIGR02999 family)
VTERAIRPDILNDRMSRLYNPCRTLTAVTMSHTLASVGPGLNNLWCLRGSDMVDVMHDVTLILSRIESGDPAASEELLPLVYDELRRLAGQRLSLEDPGQTLQATALVHEAYVRLVDGRSQVLWNTRGHFFGAAGRAMRRILVERARQKNAAGCDNNGDCAEIQDLPQPERKPELLELDAALDRLALTHPEKAELVTLRYFAGCSLEDAAEMIGVSRATAQRYWAYARAWLLAQLSAR